MKLRSTGLRSHAALLGLVASTQASKLVRSLEFAFELPVECRGLQKKECHSIGLLNSSIPQHTQNPILARVAPLLEPLKTEAPGIEGSAPMSQASVDLGLCHRGAWVVSIP